MSLMKRALDAARLRLGRIGKRTAISLASISTSTLPSALGSGKKTFDPVWVGDRRSRNNAKLPTPYVSKALRGADWSNPYVRAVLPPFDPASPSHVGRVRDRGMRAGLPAMSGRQWVKLRKRMYREARRITLQQKQQENGQ